MRKRIKHSQKPRAMFIVLLVSTEETSGSEKSYVSLKEDEISVVLRSSGHSSGVQKQHVSVVEEEGIILEIPRPAKISVSSCGSRARWI